MVHRINIFLLSILLVVSQVVLMNRAFAASLGGWSLGGGVSQGASVIYNGSKEVILNGAKKIATGTAKITPAASDVAKLLGKGVGGVALSVAVEQLIGAVDWVLDPANNSITYTPRNTSANSNCNDVSCVPYPTLYSSENTYDEAVRRGRLFATPEGACSIMVSQNGGVFKSVDTSVSPPRCYFTVGSSTFSGNIYTVANPTYDPTAESENKPKHLPLETAAQKVISNAAAGNAAAQQAVKAAADTMVAEAETDSTKARPIINQLEASQSIPTDQTATGEQTKNPDKPDTTDLSLEFPAFCSWAPTVCLAANVVINFPNTLTDWWTTANTKADTWANSISTAWTEFKDWMTKEDTPEQTTDVDIDQTVPTVPNTSYLNWGAYCPFSPGSQTISLENTSAGLDYDLTSWCELASDLRPFVLAAGALMSFLIASGVIMWRND